MSRKKRRAEAYDEQKPKQQGWGKKDAQSHYYCARCGRSFTGKGPMTNKENHRKNVCHRHGIDPPLAYHRPTGTSREKEQDTYIPQNIFYEMKNKEGTTHKGS